MHITIHSFYMCAWCIILFFLWHAHDFITCDKILICDNPPVSKVIYWSKWGWCAYPHEKQMYAGDNCWRFAKHVIIHYVPSFGIQALFFFFSVYTCQVVLFISVHNLIICCCTTGEAFYIPSPSILFVQVRYFCCCKSQYTFHTNEVFFNTGPSIMITLLLYHDVWAACDGLGNGVHSKLWRTKLPVCVKDMGPAPDWTWCRCNWFWWYLIVFANSVKCMIRIVKPSGKGTEIFALSSMYFELRYFILWIIIYIIVIATGTITYIL